MKKKLTGPERVVLSAVLQAVKEWWQASVGSEEEKKGRDQVLDLIEALRDD